MTDRILENKIVLATRGSELALAQAKEAAALLEAVRPSLAVELKIVTTRGDKDRTSALAKIGGDGLFVRGIEQELLAGTADIAVHCGKDLPYRIADGLTIAAVLPAASAADVLLSRMPLDELTLANGGHPVIGTGSPRRRVELKKFYPDAEFKECRGNITTRIGKLRDGEYDAIVLAKAGIERLSLSPEGLFVREFTTDEFTPAACQGILVIECRKEDRDMINFLGQVEDSGARIRFDAERAVFCSLQADCRIPAGVHAETDDAGRLRIDAMYDGRYASAEGDPAEREQLVRKVVRTLWQDM